MSARTARNPEKAQAWIRAASTAQGLRPFGGGIVAGERRIRALAEKLVEEGAIVLHRAPQVFGRAVSELGGPCEAVAVAIVLDHLRMIDREVRGALVEVLDRIPAVRHDGLDQAVGLVHRAARVVDEAGLNALPFGHVALTRSRGERPDVERISPFGARGKLRLRVALAACPLDRTLVLLAEAALQRLRPASRQRLPHDERNDDDGGDDDHCPYPCSHRSFLLLGWNGRARRSVSSNGRSSRDP